MKKILGILSALLMTTVFQTSCYAIQFSQPQDVGEFGLLQSGVFGGGIGFTNATVKGSFFTKYNKNNNRSYGKGVARFGSGEDALYVHCDVYDTSLTSSTYVGSKDSRNSFAVSDVGQKISKIATDEGITIYPLFMEYGPESEWTIIGRQKDGKFVKYIDTREITKRYFGWNLKGASPVEYRKMEVRGDTIILYYLQHMQNRDWNKFDGEFRFKWDDKAQWFGVEQVSYSSSSGAANLKAQQRTANFEITDTAQFQVVEASLAFKNFHKAITEKRYKDAFHFLSPSFRKYFGTVEKFASGYETTISSEVTDIQLVSKVSLIETYSYKLKAVDYDGNEQKTQYFSGKVKLVRQHGEWKIDTNEAKRL